MFLKHEACWGSGLLGRRGGLPGAGTPSHWGSGVEKSVKGVMSGMRAREQAGGLGFCGRERVLVAMLQFDTLSWVD